MTTRNSGSSTAAQQFSNASWPPHTFTCQQKKEPPALRVRDKKFSRAQTLNRQRGKAHFPAINAIDNHGEAAQHSVSCTGRVAADKVASMGAYLHTRSSQLPNCLTSFTDNPALGSKPSMNMKLTGTLLAARHPPHVASPYVPRGHLIYSPASGFVTIAIPASSLPRKVCGAMMPLSALSYSLANFSQALCCKACFDQRQDPFQPSNYWNPVQN